MLVGGAECACFAEITVASSCCMVCGARGAGATDLSVGAGVCEASAAVAFASDGSVVGGAMPSTVDKFRTGVPAGGRWRMGRVDIIVEASSERTEIGVDAAAVGAKIAEGEEVGAERVELVRPGIVRGEGRAMDLSSVAKVVREDTGGIT